MSSCIVATRGSALAVAQAEFLVDHLKAVGFDVEWRKFTTSGDKWLAGPLNESRGQGFFTKELEDALVQGEADILIHSLKDVAIQRPEGVITACIPEREDPADWFVAQHGWPERPVLATSSVRRARMLKEVFPDATFTWIRGNVPTRVQRVREGMLRDEPLHGTFLAASGLRRLEIDLSDLAVRAMNPEELLPAPGQGALLVETRSDRMDLVEAFRALHDERTARCVLLEREVLRGIGGGCQQPLGTLATVDEKGRFHLRAAFASEERIAKAEAIGEADVVLHQVLSELAAQGVACA
jgi:hydroxymethylbilane synthase